MRRVADVRAAEPGVREPADCDDAPPGRELGKKRSRLVDLAPGRRQVRRRRARMGGHEVPQEGVLELDFDDEVIKGACVARDGKVVER